MYGDNFLYPDRIVTRNAEGTANTSSVLGSNISGSTVLNNFPTSSTGDSLGHYHFTESGSNCLKFLNVSGSGSGGHKFYTSNNSIAPVNTATIDLNGLTIDTTMDNPSLLPLPNITMSIDIALYVASSVQVPPYNMTPNNSIWPVQVNSVCTFMTPGITYYCKVFNATTLQLNTSPDGGVPTIINTADLASRPQPILSLVTGTTPGITKTANLYQNLTITAGSDSSLLTASALTFNNINVKMNQVQPTLIYSSPVIYADGHAPATSLTIRNTYGYSGWFFRNSAPAGTKINWYFPPNKLNNTLVSDLKGISISFFNGVTTSNDNSLFITILTVPTGVNDFAPGFFHSSNTYVFNQSIQPTANTNYQGVCIIDINDIPYNYETQIQFQESTVNNPRGIYAQTDKILAVVIGSNSASPINSVEFVVNKLNLHYADCTQSYLLIPP